MPARPTRCARPRQGGRKAASSLRRGLPPMLMLRFTNIDTRRKAQELARRILALLQAG